ncbi:hypothetical protein SKAU_G00182940 [Synaphobranchus kaupii]|uniref:Polycomb group protein ASXL2 n=1 Tax=Synaphobranchus kaupii TaxID=118154 RepID=A0A9Q1FBX9_SYNKA|nr:hypothetical protein SKAU_G00182940 [Synaphobranchus kaupii]
MREKQRKKKGRTWAEAAKTVLEKYPNTAMSHKEILQVIQKEGLKEISGTSPLACLNAMLHTNSRGEQGIFYKVPGRMGVYTLKKDVSDSPKELSEDGSESSDVVSDSQSTENGNNGNSKESQRGKWKRRVPSKLQSQPASPQSRCTSPSVPAAKLISPSQKHSKKALKQALKQQQQRNQRRQVGISSSCASSSSSSQLALKRAKEMADPARTAKTAWELKQSTQRSTSPPNSSCSSSSSSSSAKTDLRSSVSTRKMSQRSDRLSARQLKRTKGAEIDVETPDSILVNTNLRALINKHTLSALPLDCQQRLLHLLPEVDRQICVDGPQWKLSSSALNNEFFTSAAQSWKERLAEGDFTPEMRLRMRQELEKEKKMEPWKEEFYESYYGQTSGLSLEESKEITEAVKAKAEPVEGVREDHPQKEEGSPSANLRPETPEGGPEAELATGPPDQPGVPDTPPPPETPEASSPTPKEKATSPIQSEEAPSKAVLSEDGPESVAKAETPPPEAQIMEKATPPQMETPTSGDTPEGEPVEAVVSDPLKRKSSSSEEEVAPSPEKRPRVSEVPPLPQTPPPRASPEPKDRPTAPRVPPLKIPVSRIAPTTAAGGGQVSPRTLFPPPLPSPGGRTGARTLADIKAQAQLARAQRAAAAAAAAAAAVSTAAGAVPGPGPGGGGGGTPPPAEHGLLPPQPGIPSFRAGVSGTRLPPAAGRAPPAWVTTATASANPPGFQASGPSGTPLRDAPPPAAGGGKLAESSAERPNPAAVSSGGKGGAPAPQTPSGSPELVPGGQPVPAPAPSATALSRRTPESPPAAGPATRACSSITSCNPLVTKLLQSKEVPLEQILPKSLPIAPPAVPLSVRRGVQFGVSGSVVGGPVRVEETLPAVAERLRPPMSQDPGPHQHQREMLNQATQEQILHTLMQRAHHAQQCLPPAASPHPMGSLLRPSDGSPVPRVALGFLARKRPSRPAMMGHYLLNVSTYGRGSESAKRAHLAATAPPACLKREEEEREEEEQGEGEEQSVAGRWMTSDLSGVKTEKRGPSDGAANPQQQQRRAEFSSLGHVPDWEGCGGTKETDRTRHPRAGIPDRVGAAQGRSVSGTPEPYRLPGPLAGYRSRKASSESQGAYCGPPPDRSPTETGGSPGYSPASSSGSVMSFSVTVTAIPADRGEATPMQAFAEGSGMDDGPSKCYCRLKAMIMCKGCGAFCHDDCIGPSKLCVSCLVVR